MTDEKIQEYHKLLKFFNENRKYDIIQERIVMAACIVTDGEKDYTVTGIRHYDPVMNHQMDLIEEITGKQLQDKVQGFLTNKRRFVDRKEAFLIAKEQNQILRYSSSSNPSSLFSEDLY